MSELDDLRLELEELKSENATMYAALLEAEELGASGSFRCKVELQRIARLDASKPRKSGEAFCLNCGTVHGVDSCKLPRQPIVKVKKECLRCRFFGTDNVGGYEVGVCRRRAPRHIVTSTGKQQFTIIQNFPIVGPDEFCGEWEFDSNNRFSEVKNA